MNWNTHEVTNVVPELADYNLYTTDLALREAVQRAGAQAHESELADYGARLGSAQTLRMAEDANHFKPELHTFDRQGNRIDRVEFHPAWHGLMTMLREQNLVSQPFSDTRPGAWAAYAAGFSMHGQIEAGSQCPTSMTFASIPVLRQEPALFEQLMPKLYSRHYDARDLPFEQKTSMLIGMGMTEKQGGSDVRANRTHATPIHGEGRGADYEIVGHKWFMSAPMCDAHLVTARTGNGLSCFFVPRYRPDGSKNAVHIQRLKDKVGNRSNSSSEVEFLGAWGRMVGEEGRGIPTIIEMASYTRLNCVMGSAGTIRQAVVQAIHYARERHAFGKRLAEQPLMRNVLADMALESEAATQLMMRLTQAFALADDDPLQHAYKRIVTPAAKFWVAKRSIELSAEAMEVFGGNGYMDESPMGRLYREAPVISIWEGSGNVMALDMLRAISRDPQALAALIDDIRPVCNDDARLRPHIEALAGVPGAENTMLEALARREAQRLILLVQARLLREYAPAYVADAFIASRFDAQWGRVFGTLPEHEQQAKIIERAWPV
ncbi:acyl-CoA dehydrogenase family protein [Paraburkholderia susongensis]|nr:acyl-CoA dehydrogenase family protein [Paraburkholderia susongensis]